jgi:hypothetical protein
MYSNISNHAEDLFYLQTASEGKEVVNNVIWFSFTTWVVLDLDF